VCRKGIAGTTGYYGDFKLYWREKRTEFVRGRANGSISGESAVDCDLGVFSGPPNMRRVKRGVA
jgi:hypothetical protein